MLKLIHQRPTKHKYISNTEVIEIKNMRKHFLADKTIFGDLNLNDTKKIIIKV
jgi:hypothetical protein